MKTTRIRSVALITLVGLMPPVPDVEAFGGPDGTDLEATADLAVPPGAAVDRDRDDAGDLPRVVRPGPLSRLVGHYSQVVEIARGPGLDALEGHGTATGRAILDGRFVLLESRVHVEGQAFDSWTILGLDPETGQYTVVLLDDGSHKTLSATGRHDARGGSIRFEAMREDVRHGVPSRFRFELRFMKDGSLRMTCDFDFPDSPPVRLYTSRLHRQ